MWLAGVAVLSLRLMSGWIVVQRLRRAASRCAVRSCRADVAALARRMRVSRPVRTFESALVAVPTVVGWLRPVILLPASVVTCLSPAQLEAVVAHELAHIRRHDYLVNVLQTIVETLLFYHPGVWWLSHRIRIEREHCCDDVAVAVCGDRVEYARALADLEELRGAHARLALAATGGPLLARIRRLVSAPSPDEESAMAWLPLCAAVTLLAFVLMGSGTATSASIQRGDVPVPREWLVTARAFSAQEPAAPPRAPRAPRPADAPVPPAPPLFPGEAVPSVAPPPAAPALAAPPATPVLAAPAVPAPPAAPAPPSAVGVAVPSAAPAPPAPPAGAARAAGPALPAPPVRTPAAVPALSAPPVAPAPGAVPALPAPPARVAPVPPAPMAPALPRLPDEDAQEEGHLSWSDGSQRIEVRYRGRFEIADDDRDVVRMSPGGYLTIAERAPSVDRRVELRASASGAVARPYFVGGRERPYEPEGRAWLAEVLLPLVRRAGFAAEARVARIFGAKGVDGVLVEISHLESDYVRGRYFRLLFERGPLTAVDQSRALRQAGAEIGSDYELAELLRYAGRRGLTASGESQMALVDAAASIESDYELRRVVDDAIERDALPPATLVRALQLARSIDSDYELASLLVSIAKTQSLDAAAQKAYFDALALVGSDYEARRVLDAVAASSTAAGLTLRMLDAAVHIDSDYELAEFLTGIARRGLAPDARVPFFRAVDTIQSAHERGRVLRTLTNRTDLTGEAIGDLIRSAAGVTNAHERAEVLVAVATRHLLDGALRDAYIAVAEGIGSEHSEQRALAALTQHERRAR